jgi:hypothetical protein
LAIVGARGAAGAAGIRMVDSKRSSNNMSGFVDIVL